MDRLSDDDDEQSRGNEEEILWSTQRPRVGELLWRGQRFPLYEGDNLVGKDPVCEVRFAHKSVSGKHAEIIVQSGVATLRDLRSSNGTFLEDPVGQDQFAKVSVLNNGRQMQSGAKVRFGMISCSFHLHAGANNNSNNNNNTVPLARFESPPLLDSVDSIIHGDTNNNSNNKNNNNNAGSGRFLQQETQVLPDLTMIETEDEDDADNEKDNEKDDGAAEETDVEGELIAPAPAAAAPADNSATEDEETDEDPSYDIPSDATFVRVTPGPMGVAPSGSAQLPTQIDDLNDLETAPFHPPLLAVAQEEGTEVEADDEDEEEETLSQDLMEPIVEELQMENAPQNAPPTPAVPASASPVPIIEPSPTIAQVSAGKATADTETETEEEHEVVNKKQPSPIPSAVPSATNPVPVVVPPPEPVVAAAPITVPVAAESVQPTEEPEEATPKKERKGKQAKSKDAEEQQKAESEPALAEHSEAEDTGRRSGRARKATVKFTESTEERQRQKVEREEIERAAQAAQEKKKQEEEREREEKEKEKAKQTPTSRRRKALVAEESEEEPAKVAKTSRGRGRASMRKLLEEDEDEEEHEKENHTTSDTKTEAATKVEVPNDPVIEQPQTTSETVLEDKPTAVETVVPETPLRGKRTTAKKSQPVAAVAATTEVTEDAKNKANSPAPARGKRRRGGDDDVAEKEENESEKSSLENRSTKRMRANNKVEESADSVEKTASAAMDVEEQPAVENTPAPSSSSASTAKSGRGKKAAASTATSSSSISSSADVAEKAPAQPEPVRLLFTKVEESTYAKQLKKIADIEVTSDARVATHCVTTKELKRTPKLMVALNSSIRFILSEQWVVDSAKIGTPVVVVDPASQEKEEDYAIALRRSPYIVQDKEKEQLWGFEMAETLARIRFHQNEAGKVFEKVAIFVTKGLCGSKAPSEEEMQQIVESGSGVWIKSLADFKKRFKGAEGDIKLVVVSHESIAKKELKKDVLEAAKANGAKGIYTVEIVFQAVLRQQLDLDKNFLDGYVF